MQQPRLANLQGANNPNRSSTSLITPALTALADPTIAKVDAHLFEFLSAEAIKVLTLSERVSRTRRLAHEQLVESEVTSNSTSSTLSAVTATPNPSKQPPPGSKLHLEKQKERDRIDREEADEGVRKRIDEMGFKVGWSLSESLSRDRVRFPSLVQSQTDSLELVKFICKDVWISLYDKQVDNLRTNHRGVYVLVDNSLKSLGRLSGTQTTAAAAAAAGSGGVAEDELAKKVKFFLAFPSGIIRGALANLGISCTVTAECVTIPQCTFQIKTVKPGAV